MRKYNLVFLVFCFFYFSCRKDETVQKHVKTNDFINTQGDYFLGSKKIRVASLKNDSFIFGIANNRNKVLYQSSIFKPYSSYNDWFVFIDRNKDIWFYNSDYQELIKLVESEDKNSFTSININQNNKDIPKEVLERINK